MIDLRDISGKDNGFIPRIFHVALVLGLCEHPASFILRSVSLRCPVRGPHERTQGLVVYLSPF